jgi:asparagine synthase (glutamine-hydrolysing)
LAPRVDSRSAGCVICGITGFYAQGQPLEPWFARATEMARHRGPDGEGAWALGWSDPVSLAAVADGSAPAGRSVALGFVRLSILDLGPTGSQPMLAAGRAALVFNGEIYNYVELRDELQALGWSFASSGDTEVLLKGWLQWRDGVFARLNGMWAVAIYDADRDGILLSRDRFGEKPLFWTAWRGGVAFASEVKQLRSYPDVPIRLDRGRAAAYIRSGRPYDGPSSWFEGIHQVKPGESMWVDRTGHRSKPYWSLRRAVAAIERSGDPEAWQHRFADALTRSVRIRLRSDVPVGTSLSAGIDSSAVMAEATSLGHAGYHSFTLTSDDRRVDEGPEAGAFARRMGSVWHPVPASGRDFAASWDRMTWHQETPVPSTSLYGQWKVLEAARDAGVIVLLDGQGADEILGGYHKFMASVVLSRIRSLDVRTVPLALAFARHLGGPRTIVDHGHRYIGRFGRPSGEATWLRATPHSPETAPAVDVGALAMRIADIERWSLPNLLSYVDRSAMAFGVETRLPYLDPEVATIALAMPTDVLVRGGWSKWPLRQTLADRGGVMPAWRRGKRWFGVPQRAWLRGPLKPHVEEWRRSPHPLWAELVDVDGMQRQVDLWRRRRRPGAAAEDRIFALVALDRFFRTWFGD